MNIDDVNKALDLYKSYPEDVQQNFSNGDGTFRLFDFLTWHYQRKSNVFSL